MLVRVWYLTGSAAGGANGTQAWDMEKDVRALFAVFKIEQLSTISKWHHLRHGGIAGTAREIARFPMTTELRWQEVYRMAVLETDPAMMPERIQAAESAIHSRLHTLSEDHGGTPEERLAIADAVNAMRVLLRETAEWRNRGGETSNIAAD